MSTAEILLLGAIAGCTIFIGLPVARLRSVTPSMRAMLAATATGILLFLFWDATPCLFRARDVNAVLAGHLHTVHGRVGRLQQAFCSIGHIGQGRYPY